MTLPASRVALYTPKNSLVTAPKDSLGQEKKTNIILGLPIPKFGGKNIHQLSIAPSLLAKGLIGKMVRMHSAEAAFKVIGAMCRIRGDYWRFSPRTPFMVDVRALWFGNRLVFCGGSHRYRVSVGGIFFAWEDNRNSR